MRSIPKSGEPRELAEWKRNMRDSPQNLEYDNLPKDIKDPIKSALLKEQGWLCGYTMRQLTSIEDCHIEHIEPQNDTPEKDLNYSNMAACFPHEGGNTSHGYGAPVKGGAKVQLNVDFVSPHHQSCERRFQYDALGQIFPRENDAAAKGTIELLNLDHDALKELRRRAIEVHGLSHGRRTTRTARALISASAARRLAEEIKKAAPNGRLEAFCIAISQVAQAYADKEEDWSQRVKSQR